MKLTKDEKYVLKQLYRIYNELPNLDLSQEFIENIADALSIIFYYEKESE